MTMALIHVTIWNEFVHEQTNPAVARVYPQGLHGALASALASHPELQVRTATLREPEHGLTEQVLAQTDVLTWWGHAAHDEVSDAVVAQPGLQARTATLREPEHGLTEEVLAQTDVPGDPVGPPARKLER